MEAEIRDFNDWNWDFIDNQYKGIPLKHAFDMITSVNDIRTEKECQTSSISSNF